MKNEKSLLRRSCSFILLLLTSVALIGCSQTNKEAKEDQTGTPNTEQSQSEGENSETGDSDSESNESITGDIEEEDEWGESDTNAKNAAYLKHYFGIEFPDGAVTAELFNENLKKAAGDDVSVSEGELTYLSAIQAAVKAADYDELALSYTDDKLKDRLSYHGITQSEAMDDMAARYLMCAADTGLIDIRDTNKAAEGADITAQESTNLLMAVVYMNGDGRNYLGYSYESDIYARLDNMWNSFIIFDDKKLTELGKSSVEKGITTGYNLKTSVYDARFLPELTMQYGHSDIKHAHQLIGLLRSENIMAKVQLEPKVSVYQYLLEWGDIPETTPTYEVKKFSDDLYLVFAVEYDLMLEFDSEDDMLLFDSIIEKYAKKYEGNEEAKGLIYSSWWQPLYSTVKEGMPSENYHEIYDCVVRNGEYSIHPFALPENLDHVVSEFKKLNSKLTVEPNKRYCNTAFYNYMKGEDYQ